LVHHLHKPGVGGRAGLTWHNWHGEEDMRQPMAAVAAAVISISIAGCASTVSNAESPTTTRPMIPRPLVERELSPLLLNPDQVNAAMGTAGMAVTTQQTAMSDDSATMAPPECLALDGAAEAPVYADSGYWAERDQSLNNGDKFTHYLKQAVVLFPTIEKAGEFVNTSAGRWAACHEYTHTQSGTHWIVGPISNTDGTLSATTTFENAAAPGWGCGRALSHRNNVVVDVNTCSADPADSAVRIAKQLADNVTARW
jgi:hypothetical protein